MEKAIETWNRKHNSAHTNALDAVRETWKDHLDTQADQIHMRLRELKKKLGKKKEFIAQGRD
ncbi:hypothetical protein PT974_07263 [Cladobotryum mycophilum]|uniref:Uncharacterized protein n=1 Tax=Cladobotryum mycophilum TaxID=491253 RepID=A0ABR0SPX4_9HYPO